MNDSLRDQLLKAGLVTEKQARKASVPPDRRPRGKRPAPQQSSEAQQAQAAKAARDRELNRQRQAGAEAKARHAQIAQLIEQNRLPTPAGDDIFNFVAGGKIRRIAVNAELRERLGRGELVIVRHGGHSALVLAAIGERIRALDERFVIPFVTAPEAVAEDDPYRDFVVPDDLRW